MSTQVVLNGLVALDLQLTPQVKVELRPDGLALRHESVSQPAFLATDHPPELGESHRQAVARVSGQARAIVSVSSKDGPLTAAAVAAGNGARRYLQPPGALTPELNQLLLLTAHEVICNLEEWGRLGREAGLD